MTLTALRNEYEGERIFLIGNGPSLRETPLNHLTDEYTFGMKKINHIYDETDWRPSFYFNPRERGTVPSKQQRFIEENIEMGIDCFLERSNETEFGRPDNVHYINRQELKKTAVDPEDSFHGMNVDDVDDRELSDLYKYWSEDASKIAYTYHSMYGVLQIVSYMGFDEVYLVGCDLGYAYHDPHMIFEAGLDPLRYLKERDGSFRQRYGAFLSDSVSEGVPLRSGVNSLLYWFYHTPILVAYAHLTKTLVAAEDPNHFDPTYRVRPKDNTYANDQIRKSHKAAKRILNAAGIEVYNATIGGNLEVYPRVDIDSIA
jgi:hypothetical protein